MVARALEGRIALVTGASRGIGAAVARRLGASGARVVLLARSKDRLQALAAEIGGGAVGLACDVRDTATLQRAIDQIPSLVQGRPDIIVNNAGAFLVSQAAETPVDAFAEMIAVNLVAPFAVVRAILPHLKRTGRGHIVNIGSIADHAAFAGNAAYSSSKYGLRGMHEVLRAELRGSGIRTTLVSPGAVDTEIWDPIDPDNTPGFAPRSAMLSADVVADAVHYAVTAPVLMNVDEMRLSRS